MANLAESGYLFPEAEPLLRLLSPRFKLGLVTNGLKEVQRKRFAMTPVERYLSCIVVSDEVGVQKPDPGIFEHALEAAGHTDKSTVIMVGDSLNSDIREARPSGSIPAGSILRASPTIPRRNPPTKSGPYPSFPQSSVFEANDSGRTAPDS